MGITSKKQKDIPKELQPFSNEYNGAEFESIPAFDNSVRKPHSGVGVPTTEAVEELQAWMNINKL